ncbi:hypothetical protein J6590_059383 [Homalodisca vitripennis]|nr:hypothetical protein J6590_059383 [Homalodisca vitripennis]
MTARQGLSALLPTPKLLLYKTIVKCSSCRDIRGSSLVSTHIQDNQEGTRSLPEQDALPIDEHIMSAGLPSLHEYITCQARAMYGAAAESPWEHIRE